MAEADPTEVLLAIQSHEAHLRLDLRGWRNADRKLTPEKVAHIKASLRAGESRRSIASRFDVTPALVGHIGTGRAWSHIPGKCEPTYVDLSLPGETWQPIPQSDGLYSVSNFGRVRRERRIHSSGGGTILASPLNPDGYPVVNLPGIQGRRTWPVHRLVASSFLGPCPNGMEINHKSGVKTDNHPENLEYVTHLQNLKHMRKMGLVKKPSGRKGLENGQAILTEGDVLEIRQRLATGETQQKLANEYRVSRWAITDIKRRRNWTHI